MPRERIKIDNKIRRIIKHSVRSHHRSMFFLLGENARDKVVFLHHFLVKCRNSVSMKNPSILWCYKKDTPFSIHHQKKLKRLKNKYAVDYSMNEDDVFDHFLVSSNIHLCHYSENSRIMGQTFGMLILQDFQSLTPNILACLIECVEGGGMILFLLPGVTTIEDLYDLNMDAHTRFITESHPIVSPLFNKRLVSSLTSCINCLVLDDNLNIRLLPQETELIEDCIKEPFTPKVDLSHVDLDIMSSLCCTNDQQNSLSMLTKCLHNTDVHNIVSLTSGRGRGKSSTLGLGIAQAIHLGYSNVYVTSPHVENVQTLFAFFIKGLQAFNLVENVDYSILFSPLDSGKFTTGVKLFRPQIKTVSHLPPTDFQKVGNADLIVIDEAAAIPLSLVKKWIGSSTVFMASTVNGYEGTGRSLSLKLISHLRNHSYIPGVSNKKNYVLHESELNEAVRYSNGDPMEKWLNQLLCLEAVPDTLLGPPPNTQECQLYHLNRDILFSGHKDAEKILQQVMSLLVSSHYKNSPNDLLLMADAPAHQIFCLLHPRDTEKTVLCVIQVALEGGLAKSSVQTEQWHGRRASGDLIPWCISQQFQDNLFPTLLGARIVRITTHPEFQKMGYGLRSLSMLCDFYDGSCTEQESRRLDGELPLFLQLSETEHRRLHYVGVSYGLTYELLKFWKKCGFMPLYIRQTTSEVTGEHSCIMIRGLNNEKLNSFHHDFCHRLLALLPSSFRSLPTRMVISLLHSSSHISDGVSPHILQWLFSNRSISRLKAFFSCQVDNHLILDLVPAMARLIFTGCLGSSLSQIQECVLMGMGVQGKTVEECATELDQEPQLVVGLFRKALAKVLQRITNSIQEVDANMMSNKQEKGNNSVISKDKMKRGFKSQANNLDKQIKKQKIKY